VITGSRRVVSGRKEVAKCVASRRREHVAWSIEAAFPVGRTELVRHCHSTGKAPQHSSGSPPEMADSSQVTGENSGKGLKLVALARLPPVRIGELSYFTRIVLGLRFR
jgi:hypothetical protein